MSLSNGLRRHSCAPKFGLEVTRTIGRKCCGRSRDRGMEFFHANEFAEEMYIVEEGVSRAFNAGKEAL